jgi:hypothetical protein
MAGAIDYALPSDVIFVIGPDDTGRLFDLDGNFYALTTTGAQMLQETLEHGITSTVQKIASQSSQYRMDAQRVQTDLNGLLRELEGQGLLWGPSSQLRLRKPANAFPFLLSAPALHLAHGGFRSLKTRAWVLLTLARLSLRFFGWNRTVATWLRYRPDVQERRALSVQEETVRTIEETVRAAAASYLLGVTCKERSLCCWALLRAAGVPAGLVLGINLFPLASHCWCAVGSAIVTDFPDRCEHFTPVLRYE